jgi:S-adenosylmethionine decarboxylase
MNEIINFTERIADVDVPVNASDRPQADPGAFQRIDGFSFAGVHLLLDLWGARHLHDATAIEHAFLHAVMRAGATLLHTNFHTFTPFGGVSGVAVLAESHISIHTWPEHRFAAADVFMCGSARPQVAARVLVDALRPERVSMGEHRRGISP